MFSVLGIFNGMVLILSILFIVLSIISSTMHLIDSEEKSKRSAYFIILMLNICVFRCLLLMFALINMIDAL